MKLTVTEQQTRCAICHGDPQGNYLECMGVIVCDSCRNRHKGKLDDDELIGVGLQREGIVDEHGNLIEH